MNSDHVQDPDLFIPSEVVLRSVRSVLFVCLGNICRSPTAQGVFEHLATRRGVRERLRIESRGTGSWHEGELPDPRTRAAASRHGVELVSRARVLDPARDLAPPERGGFDLILPMDRRNRSHLIKAGAPPERVVLFRAFDPHSARGGGQASLEVPDPYDDGPECRLFDEVFEIVRRSSEALLDRIFPAPS